MPNGEYTGADGRQHVFDRRVEPGESGCLLWTGGLDRYGYGKISVGGNYKKAHRVAWERVNGPIPPDLTIDHLCRVRRCVNPAHMELVTMTENTMRGQSFSAVRARQTHCKNGHPLEGTRRVYGLL